MSGTMHLFAISGLHIGVIATVLAQTMTLLRLPRWLNPASVCHSSTSMSKSPAQYLGSPRL